VHCGNRQGSGTVVNGEKGYVLTSAHVVMDVSTGATALSCTVGFLEDPTARPVYLYRADIVRSTFQADGQLDFAILHITDQISSQGISLPFPSLKTDEFAVLHDSIHVLGFAGGQQLLFEADGSITGFRGGHIQTNALISPGDSGGAGLDDQGNLVGIPTRIATMYNADGSVANVSYELVDIRAVENWLDLFSPNLHDQFFTHADPTRFHQTAVFVHDTDLGCEDLVKTSVSPSVFCLLPNSLRRVFPNADAFHSWFPDFSTILQVAPEDLADFRVTGNVTLKPGSLVKFETSPNVFLVVDSSGLLRLVPSETKALQLWGPNWGALVHGVSDLFFSNYSIGQALDE